MYGMSARAQKLVKKYWGNLEGAASEVKRYRETIRMDHSVYDASGYLWSIRYPKDIRGKWLGSMGDVTSIEIISALLVSKLVSWEECKFEGRHIPFKSYRVRLNAHLAALGWKGPFLVEDMRASISEKAEKAEKAENKKIQKLLNEKTRLKNRLVEIENILNSRSMLRPRVVQENFNRDKRK